MSRQTPSPNQLQGESLLFVDPLKLELRRDFHGLSLLLPLQAKNSRRFCPHHWVALPKHAQLLVELKAAIRVCLNLVVPPLALDAALPALSFLTHPSYTALRVGGRNPAIRDAADDSGEFPLVFRLLPMHPEHFAPLQAALCS